MSSLHVKDLDLKRASSLAGTQDDWQRWHTHMVTNKHFSRTLIHNRIFTITHSGAKIERLEKNIVICITAYTTHFGGKKWNNHICLHPQKSHICSPDTQDNSPCSTHVGCGSSVVVASGRAYIHVHPLSLLTMVTPWEEEENKCLKVHICYHCFGCCTVQQCLKSIKLFI